MLHALGVYISVPFCRAKCTFCNFASGVFGAERMQEYVNRLCGEIRTAKADASALGADLPQVADSIYFGGGTPSLLSAGQMRQVFGALRGEFEVAKGAEITLECAPGQMGEETLEELLRQGMNRVSFGVQSFVDREAAAVGRLHTREMCLGEIRRVRAAGVTDISVDLVVGLPHQTRESWRKSVEIAIASEVPHMSVYMLEVDGESRLGREMLAEGARYGACAVPGDDETAEWYGLGCEWLAMAGVKQYEISNFAREGRESRHNMKYWRREPYVGFGLDAHSMLQRGADAVRTANTDNLDAYLTGDMANPLALRGAGVPTVEMIGREQGFEEALFLGLRMNEGVDLMLLREKFSGKLVQGALDAMAEVEEAGLVEFQGGHLRLTECGRMASNEVFGRLLVGTAA